MVSESNLRELGDEGGSTCFLEEISVLRENAVNVAVVWPWMEISATACLYFGFCNNGIMAP